MSFEIKGKYASAYIFTDLCDETAKSQVLTLLNQPMSASSHPRFMPDINAGTGCVVGTTLHIVQQVVPNLVGGDIGCGMEVTYIQEKNLDFERLDHILHEGKLVPSGFHKRNKVHTFIENCHLDDLYCKNYVNIEYANLSLGTLGGGNHFIEIDRDQSGNYILVIHSGSRYLGNEVCKYYQKLAIASIHDTSQEIANIIQSLKEQGRQSEIQDTITKIQPRNLDIPDGLAYLEGENLEHYLHDMKITQEFAMWSRKAMSESILSYMGWHEAQSGFTTIHNYIDVEERILRKGAISAKLGEKVIIPLSMKDGAIIAIGKGNPEWNYSAPHGAGRVLTRTKAKDILSLEEFSSQMQGIYTTCISKATLDESPMAYKPPQAIIDNIQDTVDVIEIIQPVYNFKAS